MNVCLQLELNRGSSAALEDGNCQQSSSLGYEDVCSTPMSQFLTSSLACQ
jgi:hypothetical protein